MEQQKAAEVTGNQEQWRLEKRGDEIMKQKHGGMSMTSSTRPPTSTIDRYR